MPWVTSAAPAPLSPDTLADRHADLQRLIRRRTRGDPPPAAAAITANLGDLRDGPVGLEGMPHALLIVGPLCVMAFTHTVLGLPRGSERASPGRTPSLSP